ncbi:MULTISPECIES: hypothetical protein [Metabacillus]|uniref:Uncharacterized protein n=2 Tax=Metabacillus TaxID=2675233 RepID=A0A179SQ85_9BACI|nr:MULTISPECIES: hypothetical protein [Metabacillus]OAS82473.1 hypothetical protein A6K24_12530 [Metabacillus litoralis]QNF26657.1 hypothetical protein HUW50_03335 [Metabacillus sp. KUDC1714]
MNLYKLNPLKEWTCDVCSEVISDTNSTWLEWETNDTTNNDENFRLVHQECKRSSTDSDFTLKDLYLYRVVGQDGLAKLLNTLEHLNLHNLEDFTEIIRRLHLPYYEEARQYLSKARSSGDYRSTEITEKDCKNIISEYAKETI